MYKILLIIVMLIFTGCSTKNNSTTIFQQILHSSASPEQKAQQLLEEMTYEEKVRFILGEGWKNQGTVKRLGVPTVSFEDSSSGIFMSGTSFPAPLVATCSWNRELLYKMAEAIAIEGRAKGKRIILAPGVNIYRIPTCGRNFEYMGEDPYLAAEMSVSYIKGMQQNGTVAVVKHLVANNQEYDRHTVSSEVDQRTLREIYLPPFEESVKAGVGSVMAGYNPCNGFPMSENKAFLIDLLKEEWGFSGFVMSDFYSVYSTEGPFVSGLDLEMPEKSGYFTLKNINAIDCENKEEILNEKIFRILKTYFQFGVYDESFSRPLTDEDQERHDKLAQKIAEEGIVLLKNQDQILPFDKEKKQTILLVGYNSRHMNTTAIGSCTILNGRPGRIFSVNLLDGLKPYQSPTTKIRHATLAETAALKKADTIIYTAGWHIFGEGEVNDRSWDLREKDLKAIKKLSQLNKNVIVVSNYGGGVETESWISGVKGFIHVGVAGKWADMALGRILFGDVNPSGRLAYSMVKEWEDFAPAYYQKENPDLFINWPRDTPYVNFPLMGVGPGKGYGGDPKILKSKNLKTFEYSPDAYDKMKDMVYAEGRYLGYRFLDKMKRSAQFPFGFGLSYTDFEISNLRVSSNSMSFQEGGKVTVTVKNSGKRFGGHVVQLYVHDPVSRLDRVYKELKGFQKVFLQPGESKEVEFILNENSFRYYDDEINQWVLEPGEFHLLVGDNAQNCPLVKVVTLK